LSIEVVVTGDTLALNPKALTPSDTGSYAKRRTLPSTQFDIIPDFLYPDEGHYRVGPNGTILEWLRTPDTLLTLTFDQFIGRVRRSNILHLRVWVADGDAVGSDERAIATAGLLAAIHKARVQLASNR
jgi:hypothetical protein